MDWNFAGASLTMLLINLIYAVVALFIGFIAIRLLDRVLLKKIILEEEIKKGNMAAALVTATFLLFVAIFVGFALAK